MQHVLVFYDGQCALCQFWVRFLIRRDRKDVFRFAALDSRLARVRGVSGVPESPPDTVVVIRRGRVLTRSAAALRILADLGGLWRLVLPLLWVPRVLRDAGYDWLARNRYRWFGKEDHCLIPDPAWRHKFVDESIGFSEQGSPVQA
jgi:predicted DCC family thiol-disulfide oxidoreductase YuxK